MGRKKKVVKKKSTSIRAAVENVANAFEDLEIPKLLGDLTDDEIEAFHIYSRGKAKQDWFPHEALHLVTLAKATIRLREYTVDLEIDGPISESATGNQRRSAIAMECEALTRSILAMTRTLNLASASRQKGEQVTPRAKKEQGARGVMKNPSLLAVPNR